MTVTFFKMASCTASLCLLPLPWSPKIQLFVLFITGIVREVAFFWSVWTWNYILVTEWSKLPLRIYRYPATFHATNSVHIHKVSTFYCRQLFVRRLRAWGMFTGVPVPRHWRHIMYQCLHEVVNVFTMQSIVGGTFPGADDFLETDWSLVV